jgi:hypothetical protein
LLRTPPFLCSGPSVGISPITMSNSHRTGRPNGGTTQRPARVKPFKVRTRVAARGRFERVLLRAPSEAHERHTAIRAQWLRRLLAPTADMVWTRDLLIALLDELCVDDVFDALVGDPKRLPKRRYAQAVAMALLLRHSWRWDDLSDVATRLGLIQNSRRCASRSSDCHSATPRGPRFRSSRRI